MNYCLLEFRNFCMNTDYIIIEMKTKSIRFGLLLMTGSNDVFRYHL